MLQPRSPRPVQTFGTKMSSSILLARRTFTRTCWFCELFTSSPICARSLKLLAVIVPNAVIKSRTWIPASSAGEPGETRLTTTIGVRLSGGWLLDEDATVTSRTSGGIFVDVNVSFDSWKYFSNPSSIDRVSCLRSFCKQMICVRAIRTDCTSMSDLG